MYMKIEENYEQDSNKRKTDAESELSGQRYKMKEEQSRGVVKASR